MQLDALPLRALELEQHAESWSPGELEQPPELRLSPPLLRWRCASEPSEEPVPWPPALEPALTAPPALPLLLNPQRSPALLLDTRCVWRSGC